MRFLRDVFGIKMGWWSRLIMFIAPWTLAAIWLFDPWWEKLILCSMWMFTLQVTLYNVYHQGRKIGQAENYSEWQHLWDVFIGERP